MSVCRSVGHNFLKGAKLHFHAPIEALVSTYGLRRFSSSDAIGAVLSNLLPPDHEYRRGRVVGDLLSGVGIVLDLVFAVVYPIK